MKAMQRSTIHPQVLSKGEVAGLPGARHILATAFQAFWPLYAAIGVYVLAVWAWVGRAPLKVADVLGVMRTVGMVFIAAFLIFVVGRFLWYVFVTRPEAPMRALVRDVRDILGNPARLLGFFALFPAVYLFIKAFSVFKGMIAHTNPFQWDATFMWLDEVLHGGVHPWQWLSPLLHSPEATWIINFVYNAIWFPLLVLSLFWAMLQRRVDETPLRYLVAFLLAWTLGGSLMAWYFSSAGPAFYHHLGLSPDPYTGLRAYLEQLNETMSIWAVNTQKLLWEHYLEQNTSLGGISAFPSMHNAQAMLLLLLAWRLNRVAGMLMLPYVAVIALGSVWLAWHYAVDAYAGFAVAMISWWLAGPVTQWMMRRPAMHELLRLQALMDPGWKKR